MATSSASGAVRRQTRKPAVGYLREKLVETSRDDRQAAVVIDLQQRTGSRSLPRSWRNGRP